MATLQDPARVTRDALISAGYLADQVWLHRQPRGYGGKGAKWAAAVGRLAAESACGSILDYGCGEGSLGTALRAAPLGLEVREYDPAMPGKDQLPAPADLVVCTDVLEHVEPAKLDAVLEHLAGLTRICCLAVIATRPASKVLKDGRNAHLTVESAAWWTARLDSYFRLEPGPGNPHPKPAREVSLVARPRC
jgi:hypothetical protein